MSRESQFVDIVTWISGPDGGQNGLLAKRDCTFHTNPSRGYVPPVNGLCLKYTGTILVSEHEEYAVQNHLSALNEKRMYSHQCPY